MAKALGSEWSRVGSGALLAAPKKHHAILLAPLSQSKADCRQRRLSLKASVRQRTVLVSAAAEASPAVPSQDDPKDRRPTAAQFARTIVELSEEGSLSTILSGQGLPLGTHVPYVLDASGRPILALPSHSVALANLEKNNQCSLHVQVELPGLQKPQVTICGKATPPEDAAGAMRMELAWSRKHGDAASSSDSTLWQLSVERLLVAPDVDQEPTWIDAEDFLDADADPLKDVAKGIVDDMNREHWQDLGRVCYAYADVEDEVDEATITWVDRLGFDMRVWVRPVLGGSPETMDIRIPFEREANDEREARSNITMMVQVAWEKERNYNPQMPSIIPAPIVENQ